MTVKRARELEIEYISKYSRTIVNERNPTIKHNSLGVDVLKQYVAYDESSPTFLVWIKSSGRNAKVGVKAGTLVFKNGNPRTTTTRILNINLHVSRVIYSLHHGDILDNLIIDHIDGNPHNNNNISNLRAITLQENSLNRKQVKSKRHGFPTGISLDNRSHEGRISARVNTANGVKSKSFSIKKYGYDLALFNAIAWRSNTLLENNIAVTDRHFKILPSAIVHVPASRLDLEYIGIKPSAEGVDQVTVYIRSIKFNKSFSIRKYGRDEAIRLAIIARDNALQANNLENAA